MDTNNKPDPVEALRCEAGWPSDFPMNYHDEIITITLCRGEIAATLGERGLMVRNWSKLTKALERALRSETPCRDDGHTGSSAVGELLLNRAIEQTGETFSGLDSKPDSGPNECWPSGKPWFDGSNTPDSATEGRSPEVAL